MGKASPFSRIWRYVPNWVQALFFGRPSASEMSFSADVTEMRRQKGGVQAPMAWLDGGELPKGRGRIVDLVLPASRLLRRQVTLPPTTSFRSIESAVALDMRRKTPFSVGETFDAISDVDQSEDGVRLSHWVARRDDMDALRARLAAGGYKVRRILVEGVDAPPLADFSASVYPMGRVWRGLNVLALLTLLGAGGWLWLEPVLAVQRAREAQEAEVATLTARAVSLRQALDTQTATSAERASFVERMTGRTPLSANLRAATLVFPDSVWLTDFTFSRTQVSVRGTVDGSAAQMLLDLPANRLLLAPALTGPVTQGPRGADRFEIAFQTPHAEAQ